MDGAAEGGGGSMKSASCTSKSMLLELTLKIKFP